MERLFSQDCPPQVADLGDLRVGEAVEGVPDLPIHDDNAIRPQHRQVPRHLAGWQARDRDQVRDSVRVLPQRMDKMNSRRAASHPKASTAFLVLRMGMGRPAGCNPALDPG